MSYFGFNNDYNKHVNCGMPSLKYKFPNEFYNIDEYLSSKGYGNCNMCPVNQSSGRKLFFNQSSDKELSQLNEKTLNIVASTIRGIPY